jgi:hypothetical protein
MEDVMGSRGPCAPRTAALFQDEMRHIGLPASACCSRRSKSTDRSGASGGAAGASTDFGIVSGWGLIHPRVSPRDKSAIVAADEADGSV